MAGSLRSRLTGPCLLQGEEREKCEIRALGVLRRMLVDVFDHDANTWPLVVFKGIQNRGLGSLLR